MTKLLSPRALTIIDFQRQCNCNHDPSLTLKQLADYLARWIHWSLPVQGKGAVQGYVPYISPAYVGVTIQKS